MKENENEEPSVTEAELARVLELDAKAIHTEREGFEKLEFYENICPRLARELAAARAAIKVARERLEDFARGKRTDEDPQFCVKRLSERTLEKMNELYEH